MPFTAIREFFRMEAAGGIVLVIAAALAIWVANSPLAPYYQQFLDLRLAIQVDSLAIDKPLHLWINDGLMAVFFLLVGLEIKREFVTGELSRRDDAILPFVAAIGGMMIPALIFVALNLGSKDYLYSWAIPAATDVAFALCVMPLLGSRVPLS
jgi:NhaA family Na+:H+ antiporter